MGETGDRGDLEVGRAGVEEEGEGRRRRGGAGNTEQPLLGLLEAEVRR